jgi:type IV secretory pathway VirD2 relaxase
MKNTLLLLLGAVFLAGCMHHYDLTLINGMRITRVSKPKLNKETGVYTYKDIKGRTNSISAARVVEIAPHSDNVKAGFSQ